MPMNGALRAGRRHGLVPRLLDPHNSADPAGGATLCHGCQAPLIETDWHAVLHYALDETGACPHCGTAVAGRLGPRPAGRVGRRRVPLRVTVA